LGSQNWLTPKRRLAFIWGIAGSVAAFFLFFVCSWVAVTLGIAANVFSTVPGQSTVLPFPVVFSIAVIATGGAILSICVFALSVVAWLVMCLHDKVIENSRQ
jgi:hypothetical protein